LRKNAAIIALAGVALTFVTASCLHAGEPTAPILVLGTQSEFGEFTREILRAEGFNEFQTASPSDSEVTASYLDQFDVVILSQSSLDQAAADLLARYVENGGNLIAFRPDQKLTSVFGLSDAAPKITDGYLKIEQSNDIGRGLASDILQFHGGADVYEPKGGDVIASLYRNARTPTDAPAVVSHAFGKGYAVAFTYNLPKSVALTRQGNWQSAGLEKDGIPGIRASDMFADGWVDPLKNGLNQADEQMRLLSRVLEKASSPKKPLPRLWYFPGSSKSLVLLTGDGEDSSEADFAAQLADIKSKGQRMTLYLKGTYVSPEKVKSWVSNGFEISAHVDDTEEATHPTYERMDQKVKSAVRDFKTVYGLDIRTVRNHWIVWCGTQPNGDLDFTAQAAIEAHNGIHFDCNFYHYDPQSKQGHFLGPIGNFTGSGLPMKFVNARGEVLDVYQSITQLPDEQWGRGYLLDNFKVLLDRSVDHEGYTFINLNLHTDRWKSWSRKEGLQIIDYAKRRNVPIWTAERALRFLQQRDGAEFTGIAWSNDQLSFQLNGGTAKDGLTVMIPKTFADQTVSQIARDGESQFFTVQSVKGRDYAFVPAPSGNHHFVVSYTNVTQKR